MGGLSRSELFSGPRGPASTATVLEMKVSPSSKPDRSHSATPYESHGFHVSTKGFTSTHWPGNCVIHEWVLHSLINWPSTKEVVPRILSSFSLPNIIGWLLYFNFLSRSWSSNWRGGPLRYSLSIILSTIPSRNTLLCSQTSLEACGCPDVLKVWLWPGNW